MDELIMSDMISSEVDKNLVFFDDYLRECENTISNFKILIDLGIDNNSCESLRKYISNLREFADNLSREVKEYQQRIMEMDVDYSELIQSEMSNLI